MEEKVFTGYFCMKCNMIPLIQIFKKRNNIKIYTSCKCHKQIQNIDSFIKNNSNNKIDINKISKEPIYNNNNKFIYENNIDIDLIIKKLNKIKEEMNKYVEIKNKIIDYYKRKIDEINELYKFLFNEK